MTVVPELRPFYRLSDWFVQSDIRGNALIESIRVPGLSFMTQNALTSGSPFSFFGDPSAPLPMSASDIATAPPGTTIDAFLCYSYTDFPIPSSKDVQKLAFIVPRHGMVFNVSCLPILDSAGAAIDPTKYAQHLAYWGCLARNEPPVMKEQTK